MVSWGEETLLLKVRDEVALKSDLRDYCRPIGLASPVTENEGGDNLRKT